MININQQRLSYFYEVYTHGKIRRAADNLDVDSSVVTRQIGILEKEIGFQLFERCSRGVEPTEAAELLLRYYRHTLNGQEELEASLQDLNKMRPGNIRLVMPAAFVGALMDVFNDFRHKHPHVNLSIEEVFEANKIATQILEDISHIGIVHLCPNSKDLYYYARVPLPLCMLVSKAHPLADKRTVTFAEAIRYPLSQASSGMLRQMVQSVAHSEHIELPSPVFVSNSTTARKKFACDGSGAIFMSAFSAREEIEAGKLIALEIDHPAFKSADLALITRRGKPLTAATRQLLELLHAELSSIF